MRRGQPTYDLVDLQALVARGTPWRLITLEAHANAARLGFDEADLVEAVVGLGARDFYKSMEAEKRPGLWQDVYHGWHRGIPLYIKLQLSSDRCAVVIQFKER
jgi:hypothetical protein